MPANLGSKIQSARVASGLSKAALARMANVSVPAVRLVESRAGRVSTMNALLQALEMKIVWIGYDPNLSLAGNLRARRNKLGLSQRSVAASLQVSKNTVTALEMAGTGRVATLEGLLDLLGLSSARLATITDKKLIPRQNAPQADIVYTPRDLAKKIIDHFPLSGRVLDPCRGGGAFFDQFPDTLDRLWCEVEDGHDFFDWAEHVDWIVSNPPWSRFRDFLRHSMAVADNVVFLATLNHFSTRARLRDIRDAGFGARELLLLPTPGGDWPHSGFQVVAVHLSKGWNGQCRITDAQVELDSLAHRPQLEDGART